MKELEEFTLDRFTAFLKKNKDRVFDMSNSRDCAGTVFLHEELKINKVVGFDYILDNGKHTNDTSEWFRNMYNKLTDKIDYSSAELLELL